MIESTISKPIDFFLQNNLTTPAQESLVVELPLWCDPMFYTQGPIMRKFLYQPLTETKTSIKSLRCTLPPQLGEVFSKLEVSPTEAKALCQDTIAQGCSDLWRKSRDVRVTASRAFKIYRGRKESTRLSHFNRQLPAELPALRYGREMECEARGAFERMSGKDVTNLGLVVKHGQQWLAASPDGCYINDNNNLTLLEIKCPISCQDDLIDVPYIVNGSLKKNHDYYAQLQIQMYCCNAKFSSFFVYSSRDTVHLTVPFDEEYC
jgi:putative phage-type endonuclease